MHYNFLISPQLPQGHSLPLPQLRPLHINTVTAIGPLTSTLRNLRLAQSPQYFMCLTFLSGNNSDNYDIGHHHYILEEMKEKEERTHQEGECEDTLTDISSISTIISDI